MRGGMWAGEGCEFEMRVVGRWRFVGDALLCVVCLGC